MAASSSPSQEEYEVFLSFRGEDTRDGFTGHLYNALCQKHINTYKDDENLESGHKISKIMDAIKESKICIIVFSKDFASSTWCLDEVVRILECKRDGNDIIPIFYGIEPSIVRKQEQSYAVSFSKHEQRFKDKMDKVQRWRDALNEVAAVSGYDSKNKSPEYKFIDGIVEDILSKLSRYASTWDHSKRGLIGIENHIKEIEGLLCIDSMDVRTIGLYGMGGIGKTTLALAVFQKLSHHFESRCFLRNVREVCEKHSVMKLRKELLSKLFYHDKTIPSLESTHLQERFCRTKALIVLDDLDDAISQLNELLPKEYKLGAGSRIIVTTRDAQLLKSRTDKVYEVKRLNDIEGLQLFRLHAFKHNCVLEGYEALSKTVADYAYGNPLALEVLGSSLHSKSVEEWKSALDELQMELNPKIEKVLRISFDQLGKKDKKGYTPIQDVFLDIACFHDDGVDRKIVENMIHHSGATKKISDLIDKCLIIEDRNRLSMHALIRQMGKAIVCDENKEPIKRSRLWKAQDVCHVLERNTRRCTIEGVLLDLSQLRKDVKVRPPSLSNMHHLRILRFFHDAFDYEGKFRERLGWAPYNKMHLSLEYLSDELRYFQWDLCPSKYLPSKFNPQNLVQLVMRGSQLVELPWNEGQPIGNLMIIDLRYCESLIQIQNLCGAINLQWINIEGCPSLVQLPSWFKNLNKLEHLYLGCCKNLKDGLENLPLNIEVLSLHGTAIEVLPSSFERLLNLEYLNLTHCKNLTDGIENIPLNLRRLYLRGCTRLKSIPVFPSGLNFLDASNCTSQETMSSWSDLQQVEGIMEDYCFENRQVGFTLNDCPNLEKLQEISDDCMSSSLERSDIRGCTRLKLRPIQKLCGAMNPQWLSLEGCTNLVQVPPWFKNLNELKYLDLGCCKNLKDGLENVPLNVGVLSFYGAAIEALPSSFGRLLNLEFLNLSHCKNLTHGIENLPLNLRTLFLSGCRRLKSIPVLPSGLNFLDASNCTSLETMTILSWSDLQQAEGIMEDYDFGNRQAVYPGNEIPEWFSHQTDDGNSPHIHLPPNWFPIHDPLFGFLFSVVFRLNGYLSSPHILLEINFKTNVNSDDRLHGHYQIRSTLLYDGGLEIYRREMERDHVFMRERKLNLKELFGEEWSSVCCNVTKVSFRVSIEGIGVIDWQIKKFGMGLENTWGTARKSKRRFSECSGQASGYQDKVDSHDRRANSKIIKSQSNN